MKARKIRRERKQRTNEKEVFGEKQLCCDDTTFGPHFFQLAVVTLNSVHDIFVGCHGWILPQRALDFNIFVGLVEVSVNRLSLISINST